MKRYNLYILFALFAFASLGSCQDEESFDNKVYIESASKVSNLIIKSSITTEERTIRTVIPKPEEKDIVITYKVDPSLVDTYNAAYYDKAILLRKEFYELPKPEVSIIAGSVRSAGITVYFKDINKLSRDSAYVLPVTIANANIGILASARTTYFVLRGGALINVAPNIEDNYLHIDTWVNPDPLNNLEQVTMEALFRCRNYDRMISTVMGIEGEFLIRIGDSGFPANQIQIATSSGNFPDKDPNKGLPINKWIHVALTYDSSTGKMILYVNGKIQGEATKHINKVNLGVNGNAGFYIGRSWEDSRYLAGEISECRIWNVVRTQKEIVNNPYEVSPDSEGLVAYWKCDEGKGNTVNDYTKNKNHLTSKKNIKWAPVTLPEDSQK